MNTHTFNLRIQVITWPIIHWILCSLRRVDFKGILSFFSRIKFHQIYWNLQKKFHNFVLIEIQCSDDHQSIGLLLNYILLLLKLYLLNYASNQSTPDQSTWSKYLIIKVLDYGKSNRVVNTWQNKKRTYEIMKFIQMTHRCSSDEYEINRHMHRYNWTNLSSRN